MEHELIDTLVRDATPVRPLAPPAVRLARWALATALSLIVGVALVQLRHDIAETMWTPSFLVQAGLLIGTALLAAAAALVVGVPRHPDGAAHANTERARRFGRQLAVRFGLPVHEVDERYTTIDAKRAGNADLDAGAAAIILEQHLAGLA